ncbi:alpha-2,8-polysialyltransferase family protein [Arthrobacter ginkgonis]|uniref:Alpha-2,8-polysialyltransferase family protein n=1 Tax=Arthrobacter ginkgonis TaxID=1630594 RepID=A0ABP7CAT2_9MICC
MIQLVAASTMFQVVSLAAMVDAGVLPDADERVLVLANGAQQPELSPRIQDIAGFAALATRFDRVVDLAELMWPRRPAQFSPRRDELPLWERLLRSHWGLGTGPVQLVVESIQVNPAIALCRIFHDAPILVHSDGLMSYGPTRNKLSLPLRQRLDGIVYVDLVPGLEPLLLREHRPHRTAVGLDALAAAFGEVADAAPELPALAAEPAAGGPTALVLGQYLADLGILTVEEEAGLHRDMLRAALRRGARTVVFKPHPSSRPSVARRLSDDAGELGLGFVLLDSPVLAETAIAKMRPDVVVSCFSTALATARYVFGIECEAVGTELLLERLTPYENSNRIPVTLIDALLVRSVPAPAEDPAGTGGQLQRLVETVAYCMQSKQLPELRATAEEFLRTGLPQQARYFRRRRLAALDLPIPELAVPDLAWEAGEPDDAEASDGAPSGATPSGTTPAGTKPAGPSPSRAPRLYPRALLRIGRAGRRRLGRLAKLGTRLRPEHHHAPGAE